MARRLLVVERYNSALFATLVRQFQGDDDVAVVVDRRKARRRRQSQMRELDRRQVDRRAGLHGGDALRSQGFFWVSRQDDARAVSPAASWTLSRTI